jgi:transcriptional regulator with PAS, ATPase and Fis domain
LPILPTPLQLVIVHRDGTKDLRTLPDQKEILLGRAAECPVSLEDPSISRRHAILRLGPPITIEDLGSANGTLLYESPPGENELPKASTDHLRTRRIRPREPAPIELGDTVLLGAVVVYLQQAPPTNDAQARGSPPGTPSQQGRSPVIEDPEMKRLYRMIHRVADSNISVLLLGETGVGKEVVAEAIHRASPRAERPYLRLNCAAFSEQLLESELFGYERGAFSGATQAKPGLLETANGGTVLLDEVGELPLSTQAKLLRVLEDRQVLHLGGLKPRPIDVRFLAATNRDLEAAAARGTFREDLFFRLNGVTLVIPPLRERRAEILPIAQAILEDACSKTRRRVPGIDAEARQMLLTYRWPGNVRELRNVIERALLLSSGGAITPAHLPVEKMASIPPPAPTEQTLPPPPPLSSPEELRARLDDLERARITAALEQCGGNQTQAAKLLGISRRTLVTRIAEFGLPRPRKPW